MPSLNLSRGTQHHEQTAPFKILFLCTGNSARSILGEYLIRRIAPGRFETSSAGSSPAGKVIPYAIRTLKEYRIDSSDARSKSVDEFIDAGVQFDFVITVCDNAKDNCPVWPGQPIVARWGSPDPAAAIIGENSREPSSV
jgi:arsenate reductase